MRRRVRSLACLFVALSAGMVLAVLLGGGVAAGQDRDCGDFSSQAAAQSYFISRGGPSQDPDRLDADHDGVACESLPCPCSSSSGSGGSPPPTQSEPPPTQTQTVQPPPTVPVGPRCGVERWSVKTLSDPDAGRVRLTPRPTTVARLRRLRPPRVGRDSPRFPGELATYKVGAKLVAFKEEEDSDIHLVIADPKSGKTMIVEFPDASCVGARPSAKRLMSSARRALLRACGNPSESQFRRLRGSARITGVAFFDVKHGQRGVAPNGIELHPVLGFRSLSSCSA